MGTWLIISKTDTQVIGEQQNETTASESIDKHREFTGMGNLLLNPRLMSAIGLSVRRP